MHLFATPRSSTWIVLNCIIFVIVLDSCCLWLDKGLSPVFKGQTGFEFWVLRFLVLGAPFSGFGGSVFEFWVLRFRVMGASFSRFGCFLLRSSFSSASFLKLSLLMWWFPSSETQGQSVGSGKKAGPRRKFSGTGEKAPRYRLSPNYFQKFKRIPAPDWAQKMLCIIVPNRRTVSPEFFSWVRTRRLLSRHTCPVRSPS